MHERNHTVGVSPPTARWTCALRDTLHLRTLVGFVARHFRIPVDDVHSVRVAVLDGLQHFTHERIKQGPLHRTRCVEAYDEVLHALAHDAGQDDVLPQIVTMRLAPRW